MMRHTIRVLAGALLVMTGGVQAVVPEQRLSLGFVNAPVRGGQVREVVRPLPRSDLLMLEGESASLPGRLELADSTASVRPDGQMALQVRRQTDGGWQTVEMTVRLAVDGRPVPVRLLSEAPLTLYVPPAERQVSLQVTEPVRVLLPREMQGAFSLDMAITGYAADEAAPDSSAPAAPETPEPSVIPAVPLTPAQPADAT